MQHQLNKIYYEFTGGFESSFSAKKPKSVNQILNSIKEKILENKESKKQNLSSTKVKKSNLLKSTPIFVDDEYNEEMLSGEPYDDTLEVESDNNDDSYDENDDSLKVLLLNASRDPLNLGDTDSLSSEESSRDDFNVNFEQRSIDGGSDSDEDINKDLKSDEESESDININDTLESDDDELNIDNIVNLEIKNIKPYTVVEL